MNKLRSISCSLNFIDDIDCHLISCQFKRFPFKIGGFAYQTYNRCVPDFDISRVQNWMRRGWESERVCVVSKMDQTSYRSSHNKISFDASCQCYDSMWMRYCIRLDRTEGWNTIENVKMELRRISRWNAGTADNYQSLFINHRRWVRFTDCSLSPSRTTMRSNCLNCI